MAKTNPCQICMEVPAAEFTLAAAFPQVSWFDQLVVNICEGCLLNAAYQRVQQLAEAAAHEQAQAGAGAIEIAEQLEAADAEPEPVAAGHRSKSRRPAAEGNGAPVPAPAEAPADG